MLRRMKTTAVVGLVILASAGLAAAFEEPLQVWLLILAPLALLVIGTLLHVADSSDQDSGSDDRINRLLR